MMKARANDLCAPTSVRAISFLACIRKALCERNIRVVEAFGWTLLCQCHLPR
jgi:hypothetical protein